MRNLQVSIIFIFSLALAIFGCASDSHKDSGSKGSGYNPVIDPANFVASIDNTYLPMVPGSTYLYQNVSDTETQDITVAITHDTKEILGVTCVVVRDTGKVSGEVIEDTFDWYAQDKDGNVWYFGEDTKTYENGQVVSTEGSWEAGVDGAKPGIVMEAYPKVGDSYRQEYLKEVAEDMSEILALHQSITVAYGSFNGCVKTKDWSPLEEGVVENKTFCPDVGQVLAKTVQGGTEHEELISVTAE